MNDFLEELGGMELSPEETREVLRRMAVEEFGGSERTRVRDISELTGASSEAIGRMVADMRGESWGAGKHPSKVGFTHSKRMPRGKSRSNWT